MVLSHTTTGALPHDQWGSIARSGGAQKLEYSLWIHNRSFLNHDEILGDAIVVGPADRNGNLTDVPAELKARLLEAKSLRVEIGVSAHEPRTLGRGTFKSWVSAYIFAADILSSFANLEWVKIDHD